MPRYYIRTRGPLPLELTHAGSMIIAPKSYVEISREDEGCATVRRLVNKGLLVAPKLRPPAPATAPASKPEPVLEPVPVEEVVEKPAARKKAKESSTKTSAKSKSKRTRR